MIIKFHKALTDEGGAIGTQIISGGIDALLPTVDTQEMIDGINIYRKLYLNNTGQDGIVKVSIGSLGIFNASIFPSTGDAQVVGDILGTENKYGGSIISKATDSSSNFETVNGAGGLVDIKKIVVSKNPNFTFFRVGDIVKIGKYFSTIQTITDLSTDLELELVNAVPYSYSIGSFASSIFEQNITSGNHSSCWINVLITAGNIKTEHLNTLSIILASEAEG
jgi:hypothetical protein